MYDLEFRIFARYRSFVKSKWRAFRYVVRLSSYLDVPQFPRFISFFLLLWLSQLSKDVYPTFAIKSPRCIGYN